MEQAARSRRDFLFGGARMGGRICPPGITPEDLADCTGCGKCAENCPTNIVGMVAGLPSLDFSLGECTFCGKCAEACSEPVFKQSAATRFDHIVAISSACLAFNHVDCQACRDVCPHEAIRFRPRLGSPFTPTVIADDCTGCGACIAICPVAAVAPVAHAGESQHA
jgi:ferredoxin-type protein NapF